VLLQSAQTGDVKLAVQCADTGVTHTIVMSPGEEGLQLVKSKLAASSSVQPEDQVRTIINHFFSTARDPHTYRLLAAPHSAVCISAA
jgi:hypothetical protein